MHARLPHTCNMASCWCKHCLEAVSVAAGAAALSEGSALRKLLLALQARSVH